MANYFARKAENINATDVWATTPTGAASDVWSTFTTADVLHSNNFAITVNVSTTVGEVRNDNANNATAGGSFTLSNGVTLTANVFGGTTATSCVIFSGTSGNSANIIGNCFGSLTQAAANTQAALNSSSGTLNITGNCTGGVPSTNVFQVAGAGNTGTGVLNITGDCTGGPGTVGSGHGANNASSGTLNITGNCKGTGNGSTSFHGANNASSGTLNITGVCTGGSNSASFGANNNASGTMLIDGVIQASEFAAGVGGANRSQVTLLTGPFLTSPTFGVNPIGCNAWRWAVSLNTSTYIEVPTSDLLAKRNLVTADNVTGMPDEADVKDGVIYGPTSALTGTFEQTVAPSISDISKGVWDYALSAITTSSTIGTLLKTNIDATISSRSTATTAGIADAVWDEVLTGATHNVNRSAGKRLRQIANERIIAEGQTVSATTNTITLEPIGTLCVGQTIVVTDQDTDDKQTRFILAFDTGTDTATVDSNWCVVPTAGDEYLLTTVRDPLVTRGDHPTGTVGAEIDEMYLIHGLKSGSALTVTPSSRAAGAISQSITGDGTTTTTVTRT
jgi:hypothetical protein